MTLMVAARFLAISGGFSWITRVRRPGLYDDKANQIRREIGWSLSAAAIYGIPAGVVAWGWQAHGWTLIHTRLSDYPLWWWPCSVLLYLLIHDTWFYWRSEEHTSELQSLMRISNAVLRLTKKK